MHHTHQASRVVRANITNSLSFELDTDSTPLKPTVIKTTTAAKMITTTSTTKTIIIRRAAATITTTCTSPPE